MKTTKGIDKSSAPDGHLGSSYTASTSHPRGVGSMPVPGSFITQEGSQPAFDMSTALMNWQGGPNYAKDSPLDQRHHIQLRLHTFVHNHLIPLS